MTFFKNLHYLIACLSIIAVSPVNSTAQKIREGYVDWGKKGTDFPSALQNWTKGQKWTDDDNFFISRVRPKERFRNTSTQVNPLLDDTNDKKLIFWVPINNVDFNALPDGVFDSEVFPMWSYITHYGNWTAPLVRVPGGFSDVAHKNGVAVSALASIPYGNITSDWKKALTELGATDPGKLCDFLTYYGVDGIGYNSEFSATSDLVSALTDLHQKTSKLMREQSGNPLTEFIWYDGTNSSGSITFDRGLGAHNGGIWGRGNKIGSSLFFNYNWNSEGLLKSSVEFAETYRRTPLDLYCGINMQGREPKSKRDIWPMLAKYPLSIGLWGAHSENMLFESRADRGSAPERQQRTYLDRVIRWFTGGSFNPVNTPELSNTLIYTSENDNFFGMSKLMSARSALKWDLSDEPFITYFNLGNGRFFNYKGVRCHNSEWYNIGMQDYLPTWMWWFASRFVGRDASDVPANGLMAEFVWDDAYMGGSTIRIAGSVDKEYLHLFKTEFKLQDGDVITFRYKLLNGNARVNLALSMKGSETHNEGEQSLNLLDPEYVSDGMWVEKRFTVGKEIQLPAGGEVALIALDFNNASELDLRLGEFSIVRPSAMNPHVDEPLIERSELLASRNGYADGKIVFNMPNDKGDDVCYNIDVNTSLFKLYAQQEGRKPVLMGMTPSWAGLMFSIPCSAEGKQRMRLGVSALALDMNSESEIAWGDWKDLTSVYEMSDEIRISNTLIAPGEEFSIEYTDPLHPAADWKITDAEGNTVGEVKGTDSIVVADGISKPGVYNLVVDGVENIGGELKQTTREFLGFIQIADGVGRTPKILSTDIELMTENPEEAAEKVKISYSADKGEGIASRGVHVGDKGVGFRWKDTGLESDKPFSVSLWFRPEDFKGNRIHMLNIRDKGDKWVRNNFGWFWHSLNEDGTTSEFTMRTSGDKTANYKFDDLKFVPGTWYHITYVFEYNEFENMMPHLYVNGEKQKVTSWSLYGKEQDGEAGFIDDFPFDWLEENVVAFGGYAHKVGSVNGNVDNFMLWNKALDEEGVKSAMSYKDSDTLPEGLAGYFDFEDDVDSDGLFANKGNLSFKVGMHDYISTEVEGQSSFRWTGPDYCPGSPFESAGNLDIRTEVIWKNPGAKIESRNDDSEHGEIVLDYSNRELNESMKATGYPVSLTLRNAYGEDTHDFIVNLDPSGVKITEDNISDIKITPNPFESHISIVAPGAGNYRLTLFTLDGKRLLINNFDALEGDTLEIYPEVAAGMYLLSIECDGKLLATSRVIRK